jgi:hypothetical protein
LHFKGIVVSFVLGGFPKLCSMDILFRIRGGFDLAFQLAPPKGMSSKTPFIIEFRVIYIKYPSILPIKK